MTKLTRVTRLLMVAGLLLWSAPAQAQLSTGLISWWDLEEASGTRSDALGANNLTDNNTVTSGTGKVGTGAVFATATLEDLTKTSPTGTLAGDNPLTIGLWFKPTATNLGVSAQVPIGLMSGGTGNWRVYLSATGDLSFTIWAASGFGTEVSATIASAGIVADTWYFIVASHSPTADEICIQLNNVGSPTCTPHSGGIYSTQQTPLSLGSQNPNGSNIDGMLDSVGIWGRVLDSTERTQLYNGGGGRSYATLDAAAATPHRLGLMGVGR